MALKPNEHFEREENEKKIKEERLKILENEEKLRIILTWQELQKLLRDIKLRENNEKITQELDALRNLVEKRGISIEDSKSFEQIATKLEKEADKIEKEDEKEEKNGIFWQNKYISDKIYPSSMLSRWENPENILDEIIWLVIWITDSMAAIAKLSKDVAVDFVKLPYDIYKSIT